MKQTLYFLFIFIFINSNFLTADTLPDCPSDKKQVYHNCFGTHSDPGISYTGEWQNNKMNGMGTISFENGASYAGEWKNNRMHGVGISIFPNGDKYEGEFKYGMFYGLGILSHADGKKEFGGWQNNKLNGYAIKINKYGKIDKHGIFVDDLFIGPKDVKQTNKYQGLCKDMGAKIGTENHSLCMVELINNN